MAPDRIAALTIERKPLADLQPHPRNPRKHPPAGSQAWEALRRSLEHDYFDPLVVNRRNGMLVSGHLRHKVLLASGFIEADVSVVDYDEATHLARMIAANNLLGEFADDVLSILAQEIEQTGISACLAGWDEKELAAQLEGPPLSKDDTAHSAVLVSEAEKLDHKWNVRLGDVWGINNHRLICGDCTEPSVLKELLGDKMADLVWTDPPYNVNYDSIQERRNELKRENGKVPHSAPQAILNDNLSDFSYEDLLFRAFSNAFEFTKPGGGLYVAHADSQGLITRRAVAGAQWKVAQCLIWVKNAFTLGRQDYQWQHEPILYGWKPGAAHYWQGGFAQSSIIDDEETDLKKASKDELIAIIQRLRNDRNTSVIREPRNSVSSLHPTVKPLALVARQVWNSSRRDDVVLELFGGSGTTMAAAEQTGRICFACELDPKFCAVILERMAGLGLDVIKISNHGPDQY